jgi:hypothetical protein
MDIFTPVLENIRHRPLAHTVVLLLSRFAPNRLDERLRMADGNYLPAAEVLSVIALVNQNLGNDNVIAQQVVRDLDAITSLQCFRNPVVVSDDDENETLVVNTRSDTEDDSEAVEFAGAR